MSRAVRPPRRLAPGRHGKLDQVPAVGDLTDIVQLGTGHHVSAGEGQRRVALQRRVAAYLLGGGQTLGATQRCLNPGFSERIGNSRRTGDAAWRAAPPGPHRLPAHRGAPWRCCTNRDWLARCPPTGSSPADAIRHWSAEGGHPIQDLTAENGLTPLPSWTPGAKAIADDGLVAEERSLHPALTMVP